MAWKCGINLGRIADDVTYYSDDPNALDAQGIFRAIRDDVVTNFERYADPMWFDSYDHALDAVKDAVLDAMYDAGIEDA